MSPLPQLNTHFKIATMRTTAGLSFTPNLTLVILNWQSYLDQYVYIQALHISHSPALPNGGDLNPSVSNRRSHVDRCDIPEHIACTDGVSVSHGARASRMGVFRGHSAVHSPRAGVLDI